MVKVVSVVADNVKYSGDVVGWRIGVEGDGLELNWVQRDWVEPGCVLRVSVEKVGVE